MLVLLFAVVLFQISKCCSNIFFAVMHQVFQASPSANEAAETCGSLLLIAVL